MDQLEESAEESNAGGEQFEEEIVPKIVTEEVFAEVSARTNVIMRDLQNTKSYMVVEDIQKLLLVAQNLRQNVADEREVVEQMRNEVAQAAAKVQHAVKMSMQDQEVIQQLKSEIGDKKWIRNSVRHFLIFNFIPLQSQQIKHGRKQTLRHDASKSHKKP